MTRAQFSQVSPRPTGNPPVPTSRRRSPSNHRWTEDERDFIRREYQGTHASRAAIAGRLNVSPYAVAGQITKMGIAKRSDRRAWTDEQDWQLHDLAPQLNPAQIAKRLKRSINSVTLRMKRLGIDRKTHDGWFTLREVANILGKDHKWIRRRIENGALPARRHHTPTNDERHMWHINEKDLAIFIRRYPQDLDGRNIDLILVVDLIAGLVPLK